MSAPTTPDQIPDVEERLDQARRTFALLIMLTDGLSESSDHAPYTNKNIGRWGWYEVHHMCHEGFKHVDACYEALGNALSIDAPDVEDKE